MFILYSGEGWREVFTVRGRHQRRLSAGECSEQCRGQVWRHWHCGQQCQCHTSLTHCGHPNEEVCVCKLSGIYRVMCRACMLFWTMFVYIQNWICSYGMCRSPKINTQTLSLSTKSLISGIQTKLIIFLCVWIWSVMYHLMHCVCTCYDVHMFSLSLTQIWSNDGNQHTRDISDVSI